MKLIKCKSKNNFRNSCPCVEDVNNNFKGKLTNVKKAVAGTNERSVLRGRSSTDFRTSQMSKVLAKLQKDLAIFSFKEEIGKEIKS